MLKYVPIDSRDQQQILNCLKPSLAGTGAQLIPPGRPCRISILGRPPLYHIPGKDLPVSQFSAISKQEPQKFLRCQIQIHQAGNGHNPDRHRQVTHEHFTAMDTMTVEFTLLLQNDQLCHSQVNGAISGRLGLSLPNLQLCQFNIYTSLVDDGRHQNRHASKKPYQDRQRHTGLSPVYPALRMCANRSHPIKCLPAALTVNEAA